MQCLLFHLSLLHAVPMATFGSTAETVRPNLGWIYYLPSVINITHVHPWQHGDIVFHFSD